MAYVPLSIVFCFLLSHLGTTAVASSSSAAAEEQKKEDNSTNLLTSASESWLFSAPSYKSLSYFSEETQWYNDIVLGPLVPHRLRSKIPHTAQTWLRNYIAGILLYFASGGLWSLYIYHWKRDVFFPEGKNIPSREAILLQIWVCMKAMPMYVSLPTLSEYMIENGWTRCYSSIHEVGVGRYILLTFVYLVLVEFGIYWMHRSLHDCKPLYKWLHATHHIYNKENTLSPFAGILMRKSSPFHSRDEKTRIQEFA